MYRLIVFALVSVASIAMMSCATLFSPKKNPQVLIQTNPVDAEVYINGEFSGNTPLVQKLSHKETYSISVEKEGYRPQRRFIRPRLGVGWIILDILGGLIPIIVDVATGDWFELDEESLTILLQEEKE